MIDFVAIDFETANEETSSICQVGMAYFQNGVHRSSYSSLVNPEVSFSWRNINVHGITEQDVSTAPIWPGVYSAACQFAQQATIIVSHTSFDRSVWNQATEKYRLPAIDLVWLDSAKVARHAWSDVARAGYGLGNLCRKFNIDFKHHDALEDAIAAGKILVLACQERGIDLAAWGIKPDKPITKPKKSGYHKEILQEANPAGRFYGKSVVFTGILTITRQSAAKLAAEAGLKVENSVTRNTDLVIIGEFNSSVGEDAKSNKIIAAEKIVALGHNLKIIDETEFFRLITNNGS